MTKTRLRQHFLTGLVVFLPLVLTLLILQYIFRLADAWVVDPLYRILPFNIDRATAIFVIKVLIGALVFFFICLVGFATEIFIFKRLFEFGEGLLARVPVMNQVYHTIKEVFRIFSSGKKDLFGRVVLVQYPRAGVYAMGFVTRAASQDLSPKIPRDMVGVFIASPPNPATGNLIFVPKEEVIDLNISTEEALKMIVSCGTVGGAIRPIKEIKSGPA